MPDLGQKPWQSSDYVPGRWVSFFTSNCPSDSQEGSIQEVGDLILSSDKHFLEHVCLEALTLLVNLPVTESVWQELSPATPSSTSGLYCCDM